MPEYPLQELADDIARSLLPEQFDQATQKALTFFDTLNEVIIDHRQLTLACCAGCGVCCSLRVDVFAHEVFLIARHIRSRFTGEELAGVLARLAAHADEVGLLTPFEHATRNVRCPLLVDGRCSVYPVRPHTCRRHHSQDFATCQFTFDHPADLESPAAHDRVLFRALTEAMQVHIDAYFDSGFDVTIYELGTALHEALHDSSAWERWRAREPAFLHASVTPAA